MMFSLLRAPLFQIIFNIRLSVEQLLDYLVKLSSYSREGIAWCTL